MSSIDNINDILANDIEKLEQVINNSHKYNIRNLIIRGLLNSSLLSYKILPYILSFIIASYTSSYFNDNPFEKDTITSKLYSVTTEASFGPSITTYSSLDERNSYEYSTGWFINSDNLYERVVTKYSDIDNFFDLTNYKNILTMTKEELSKKFLFSETYSIIKDKLSEEDYIYNEPTVIATISNLTDAIVSKEEDNLMKIIEIIIYFLFILSVGTSISRVTNFIIKDKLTNKIIEIKNNYPKITKELLEGMNALLELKKANLKLITEGQDNNRPLIRRRTR